MIQAEYCRQVPSNLHLVLLIIEINSARVSHARADPWLTPAMLSRQSYRDGAKVKTRTLGNPSRWPKAKVEALRPGAQGWAAGRGAGAPGDPALRVPHPIVR